MKHPIQRRTILSGLGGTVTRLGNVVQRSICGLGVDVLRPEIANGGTEATGDG